MVVFVDENGEWSQVNAETMVEFEEDRARGSGDELEYSMTTRDLRLVGTDLVPALFVPTREWIRRLSIAATRSCGSAMRATGS